MCLGVPGRVTEIWEFQGTPMARIDFGGVHKEVCAAYVPDLEVGQYAIVHVGFAITKLDEASALETLELIRGIGLLDAELNVGDVNAGEFNAGDVNAGEFNAGDVNAGEFNAGDVNAGEFSAGEFNAGEFTAGDGDLDYGYDPRLR